MNGKTQENQDLVQNIQNEINLEEQLEMWCSWEHIRNKVGFEIDKEIKQRHIFRSEALQIL